ncbi:histidine phosphatase superfamily [Aspergillus varians]
MKLSTLTATLSLGAAASASSKYINYTTIPGYFIQDDASTDPSTFDYTSHNFGLLDRTYDADKLATQTGSKNLTQWQRFHRQLEHLNEKAPKHVSYKLLFLGRHGEGWHNAAEDFYGTPAWNCYWSLLTGNSTNSWVDAELTPDGISQANIAHEYWLAQYKEQGIHFPDAYYSSPLTRSLKTANITFGGLPLKEAHAASFVPEVKEGFRESVSLHTCDHRRSKSYIKGLFPGWKFEKGLTEEDELWTGVKTETSDGQDSRSRAALDDIFAASVKLVKKPDGTCGAPASKDKDLVVSVTAHSGEIGSILRVIGHQKFRLSTGAVIPVLVRAEKVQEESESTSTVSWTASAHCTAPPVTSTASGCVCASSATPVTSGFPIFAATATPN